MCKMYVIRLSVLWCPGTPKSGKIFFQALNILRLAKSAIAIAYIYCSYKDPAQTLVLDHKADMGARLQWTSSIAFSNRVWRCKPCLCINAIGRAGVQEQLDVDGSAFCSIELRLWNQQGEDMQPLLQTKRLNIHVQDVFELQPVASRCLV